MEWLGRNVERELARVGGEAAGRLPALTAAWPAAVGEAIARQAWPLRIGRDGTLHVAAASATWAFELDRLADEILARLREVAGEAAPPAIRFRVGPVPEPGSAPGAPGRKPPADLPPSPAAAAEAAQAAAAIEDPALRELVERAARASLARTRSGRRF
jgi:hypothetical protein